MSIQDEIAKLSPEARAAIARTEQAATLMRNLLADADSAKALAPIVDRAAKKINPSHQTTEELAAPIVERALKIVDEKLAERDKKTAEEKAVANLQTQIESAKSNDGLTDEGISNILTLMKDKGVGDFETARKAYLHDRPNQNLPSGSTDSIHWNAYETMQSGDQKSFFFPDGMPSITDRPEVWEREMALKYLKGDVALPTS